MQKVCQCFSSASKAAKKAKAAKNVSPEEIARREAEKKAEKVFEDQAHKIISDISKKCKDVLQEFLDKLGDPKNLKYKEQVDEFVESVSQMLTSII